MRLFINWIYILCFLEFKMISIVSSVPGFSHKNLIGMRDSSQSKSMEISFHG